MSDAVEPVADTETVEACVCGHHESSHNPPWWSCDEPDCHCERLRLADSTDLRQRVLTMIARALCGQEETAEREGNESWWGWSTHDIAAFTADAAITALRPVVSSSTREDGETASGWRDGYPTLRHIEADVCDGCLAGEPAECHTPGCAFWCCPSISAEQGEHLRAHVVFGEDSGASS